VRSKNTKKCVLKKKEKNINKEKKKKKRGVGGGGGGGGGGKEGFSDGNVTKVKNLSVSFVSYILNTK